MGTAVGYVTEQRVAREFLSEFGLVLSLSFHRSTFGLRASVTISRRVSLPSRRTGTHVLSPAHNQSFTLSLKSNLITDANISVHQCSSSSCRQLYLNLGTSRLEFEEVECFGYAIPVS